MSPRRIWDQNISRKRPEISDNLVLNRYFELIYLHPALFSFSSLYYHCFRKECLYPERVFESIEFGIEIPATYLYTTNTIW